MYALALASIWAGMHLRCVFLILSGGIVGFGVCTGFDKFDKFEICFRGESPPRANIDIFALLRVDKKR